MKVYLTRDRDSAGGLSTYVDIWDDKPYLLRGVKDHAMTDIWIVDPADWLRSKVTMLTDTECQHLYGVVPDHFEQLILAPYRTPNPKNPRGIP